MEFVFKFNNACAVTVSEQTIPRFMYNGVTVNTNQFAAKLVVQICHQFFPPFHCCFGWFFYEIFVIYKQLAKPTTAQHSYDIVENSSTWLAEVLWQLLLFYQSYHLFWLLLKAGKKQKNGYIICSILTTIWFNTGKIQSNLETQQTITLPYRWDLLTMVEPIWIKSIFLRIRSYLPTYIFDQFLY